MAADRDLDCQDLVELVTEYLEGTLPPAERTRFDAHIAACTGCARYLAQMRQTIHATGALREENIAPPAMEDLLRTFRDWKRER